MQVGTIGLTESEAVAQYGADKVSVYETAFTAMYFALTSRKQVEESTSGHRFSPEFSRLSRLTSAISPCPMEAVVSPAKYVHRA